MLLQGNQALDSRVVNLAMTFIPTGESGGQVAQLEHQAQTFSPQHPASELQAKMQQDPPKPMQVGCPAAPDAKHGMCLAMVLASAAAACWAGRLLSGLSACHGASKGSWQARQGLSGLQR